KKDAIIRPNSPPAVPTRPAVNPARHDRIIDSDEQQIEGSKAAGVLLKGQHTTEEVVLGELRTDRQQHLLVLGGRGRSHSPTDAPIGNEGHVQTRNDAFYNNPDWHDDV